MGWLSSHKELAKKQIHYRVQFAKGLLAFGLGVAGIFLLLQSTAGSRPSGRNCLARKSAEFSFYNEDAQSSRSRREVSEDVNSWDGWKACDVEDEVCLQYNEDFKRQNLPCITEYNNKTCSADEKTKEAKDAAYCVGVMKEDYGDDYYTSGVYWCDVTDFPDSMFSIEERQNGGFLLYAIGLIYMFLALAIVCDEYFVPALECITEKLSLSDDVAGATFMAAGGSAPELFTSIIGVFVADSNVGIGTIVGSAVFNILFVLGMCAFIVGFQIDPKTGKGTVLNLTWFPLTRDCFFYVFSLVVLVISFSADEITWWESLCMIGVYLAYVIFMIFNARIEAACTKKSKEPEPEAVPMQAAPAEQPAPTNAANKWSMAAKAATAHMHFNTRTILGLTTAYPDNQEGGVENSTGGVVAAYAMRRLAAKQRSARFSQVVLAAARATAAENAAGKRTSVKNVGSAPVSAPVQASVKEENSDDAPNEGIDGNPWQLSLPKPTPGGGCKGFLMFLLHVSIMPLTIMLKYTIPDTRFKSIKSACGGYIFIISFFFSILWISVFSWLMVWWATRIGETWNIDPALMGLTFLAAGTSVPDLITSVIVAKNGQGDMAVSSSIGSNIFDVTIGLPLPWFLWSCFNSWGAKSVSSAGLICSIGLLLFMLVVLVTTIISTGWKMNNMMGAAMLLLYAVFVAISLLLEYGTITCPDIF